MHCSLLRRDNPNPNPNLDTFPPPPSIDRPDHTDREKDITHLYKYVICILSINFKVLSEQTAFEYSIVLCFFIARTFFSVRVLLGEVI